MSISLLGVLEQANAPEYIDFHNISFNDGADKFFGKLFTVNKDIFIFDFITYKYLQI